MIEATIESLASRGYAQTTMTDVAAASGVSHGLVNFHFETKEKLLTETLLYLAAEYRENWRDAMAGAAPSPAARGRACAASATQALGLAHDHDQQAGGIEMAAGDVIFAATGVTDGSMLRGVKHEPGITVCHSIVMRSATGTIRWIESRQRVAAA